MLPSVNVLRNDQKLIPISNHKQKKRKNVLGVSVKISKLKKKNFYTSHYSENLYTTWGVPSEQ